MASLSSTNLLLPAPWLFADVVLPRPFDQAFTYRIPAEYVTQCLIGHRAIVPFGKGIVIGIILHTHATPPVYPAKGLLTVLDNLPVLDTKQIAFFRWMATYYLCTLGEVLRAVLRAIGAFTMPKIKLAPNHVATQVYPAGSQPLFQALQKTSELTYAEAVKLIKPANVAMILAPLLERKTLLLENALTYNPPKITHIRLDSHYLATPDSLKQLQQSFSKKPKQQAVLSAYLAQVSVSLSIQKGWLSQKALLEAPISASSLKTLIKKKFFLQKKIPTPHFATDFSTKQLPACLTTQASKLVDIYTQWKNKNVVLLQGTSAPQLTDQYLAIIAQILQKQGQVLYLLPTIKHIALYLPRLSTLFGKHMGLYHSQRTSHQQQAVWYAVQHKQLNFVVGTRSALFLPFSNLQCIIVADEENTAYKQTISSPRYHTRDAAIVWATYHQAHVLLGSTTPSLESYYNAEQGKYGLVASPSSKNKVPIDLILLPQKTKMPTSRRLLSPKLLESIRHALATHQQVIVLHSTRGYATHSRCSACTWMATCPRCSVSLTYHQTTHQLHCHHCKYTTTPSPHCPSCGSKRLHYRSIGIQQVEKLLQDYLPTARIIRIDGDVTPYKKKYLQVLADFNAEKTDLLVSTQGLISFLPLARPALVAILDIGAWLTKPNFRAYEQCCQYLTKLVKPEIASSLLVQTDSKQHLSLLRNLIKYSTQQHATHLYKQHLEERKRYGYPPYTRLLKVLLTHINAKKVTQAATQLAQELQAHLSMPLLGPHPILARSTKDPHRVAIWLKISTHNAKQLCYTKKTLRKVAQALSTQAPYKGVHISFDVDPI